jgi:regulatory protein
MDIRDTALRFLANRDRTCREVREHLMGKGFGKEETDDLILELVTWNYLNDQAYAEKYYRYAGRKGRSIYRMKQELIQKGVSSQDMEEALNRWEEEEGPLDRRDSDTAWKEAVKITGGNPADEKMIARVGRRLHGLGYSSEVIFRILEQCRKGWKNHGTD